MTTRPGDCANTAFLDAVRESVLQPVSHPRPIVLIGAGGIARDAHLPAYRKASLPVSAVVDAEVSKAESLARDFGVSHAAASIEEAIAGSRETGSLMWRCLPLHCSRCCHCCRMAQRC